MKKTLIYIYNVRAIGRWLLSLVILFALPLSSWADEIPIRYVKTTGTYGADGKSWATAMNDVQEAIEALYTYMSENKLTEGRVYVAEGRYFPSRSTETGSDNRQHLSFLIRPGVHVFGGFAPDETNDHVDPYSETGRPHGHLDDLGTSNQSGIKQPWNFTYKTVLSGNLTEIPEKQDDNTQIMVEAKPKFTYDNERGTYKTIFYGNSYHVVWFATNGFIEATKDVNYGWDETGLDGHARALPQPASIDGCTITGGYAATKSNSGHPHTAYGAGAYMVEGASLVNCVVEKCLAMTNGGGVYMDGGGLVDNCYINTCQATGQSALQGFGGGVCINFDGAVTRSYIANNSANSGGGVAICHLQDEYPWHSRAKEDGISAQQINSMMINVYSPHATACVISNNSSTKEAGGIYLNNGGVMNHITVTNNKCYGADVPYYGRRQGRSGGVYILNGGQIYNTVVWGNECSANNDIQYACHTSGSTETLKPQVYYSAFDNHETTDWSGTTKSNVYSLASENTNNSGNNAYYPYFIGTDGKGSVVSDIGAGLETIPRPISWKPAAITGLAEKGVQVTDALSGNSEWIKHAHTETDMLDYEYEPVSSLGALVRREESMECAMVANQEISLYRENGFTQANVDSYTNAAVADAAHSEIDLGTFLPDDGTIPVLPTIFVDPLRKYSDANHNKIIGIGTVEGADWIHPVGHVNDAIHFFRKRQWTKAGEKKDWYNIGGDPDGEGGFTGGTDYPYVQILVKGVSGTAVTTTAGLDAYLGEELRTAAVRPCSNMRIYGGYDPTLTETSAERGNLREHRTRISANVINAGYENNSAHVFALSNVKNVIIDGFEIFYGNANLNAAQSYAPHGEAIAYGGGVIVNNAIAAASERIDMTGNILRNSVIAHCSAPDGAAIYVNSSNKKANGEYCDAQLSVINTIIRNNTVGDGQSSLLAAGGQGAGIVTARGPKAIIRLDHCDLVNNCGYPLETLSSDGTTANEGKIRIYNSVIYANGDKDIPNRKNITQPLSCRSETMSQDQVDGDYIYLDWDAPKPKNPPHCYAVLCRDMSDEYQKWAIRQKDEYQNTVGQIELYADEASALAALEDHGGASADDPGWTTPVLLDYPFFANPAKNVGHSEEGDKPMNGGSIDYMPQATNPMVNDAVDESSLLWDADDNPRNYGGDPDIGAVECTELLIGGSVIYVTPDGAGRRDGSSWANAIAGNLVYRVGGSYVVDETPEHSDKTLTDTNEKVVTTKNNLYRGGYAIDYVNRSGSTTYVDKQTIKQKHIHLTYNSDGTVTKEDGETINLPDKETSRTISYTNQLERVKSDFIYGEKSGASRNFYRTNVIDSKIFSTYQNADNTNTGYTVNTADITITNNRDEDYVSGLQFAVEKAAALNKGTTNAQDRVQVWVGNGVYEDYKGFVMRDKVEVLGGFPASTYPSPSLNERHALVSNYVPLSTLNASLEDKKDQYETILQPIDVKPYDNNWNFVESVQLYQDKDYTETGNKTITTETTVTIPVYYRYNTTTGQYDEEVRGDNVVADLTTKIVNPSFEQSTGNANWSNTNSKNGWKPADFFTLSAGNGNYTSIHGGEIKNKTGGFEFYQDIDGLEPGLYRVSCKGFNKGSAIGAVNLFANGEQRPLMDISATHVNTTTLNAAVALLAQNLYNDNWVDVYVGEAGHLRIGLTGTYTGNGWTVFDDFCLERLSGSENVSSTTTTVTEEGYVEKTESPLAVNSFRKPVLYMPDVCMTTNWPGSIAGGDNPSNAIRWEKSGDSYKSLSGRGLQIYTDAHWDGFTIRHGFYNNYFANRDGGAGVRMFEGGTLENCVVVDNANMRAARQRGGGGYCDGRTSKVISCFFVNNLNSSIRSNNNDKDSNGGGIYLLVGTCYNSLFANNVCCGNDSRGAGIYIEQATFYNNTVAYNACYERDKVTVSTKTNNGKITGCGVHQYEGASSGAKLNVYNTIFYKNTGTAIGSQDVSKLTSFRNCYIQSNVAMDGNFTKVSSGKIVDCILDNAGKDIDGNSYTAPNPFKEGDNAPTSNNYRLASSSLCINSGNIPADQAATFPPNDVDFADRVQDCQVDIGAYEYDGTIDIHPSYELIDFGGKRADEDYELCAVYYVTANGNSKGDSSASSPENAACATKLQNVLDAAGRLKYDLRQGSKIFSTAAVPWPTTVTAKKEIYENEAVSQESVADQPLSNVKHVIVKLADAEYMPDRSTDNRMATGETEDEILTHSLIIPHGVEVWGGYQFKNDSSDPTDFWEYTRDILNHKSILSGNVENKRTGTIGEAYHVVTFTNHLYSLNGGIYDEGDLKGENKLATAFTDTKNNRAILDGVFIQGGEANGVNDEDKIGGAGVVTGYAHIRNCIIQDNTATMRGGAFYLMPGALMSGCIMQDNSAEEGGAIYVVEPTAEEKATYTTSELRDKAYARIYNSTIVYNTASVKGGGVFFDTNIRAKGVVLWQNLANDMNNVAGTFDSEAIQAEKNYPFSYCAVQNRRLPGVNNQEVAGESDEGVRWNSDTNIYWNGESTNSTEGFYYTDRVSALVRTGIPYTMYEELRLNYPSLELTDIVGVYRMDYTTATKGADYKSYFGEDNELVTKANKYLEIGARALNTQMDLDVESAGYHMTRLFVAKPENVNSTNANILLTSGDPLYSMQGSSMANPFTKFSDALDYIVKLRNYKSNLTEGEDGYDDAVAVRNKYANTRFEIFVSGGDYYPYQNAQGEEGNARSSTFVLPEGVTIIGGLRPDRMYCQAGYEFDNYQPQGNTDEETNDRTEIHDANDQVIDNPGITLVSIETDDIREARPRYDINDNNVFEPWEFEKETVFSGNTPRGNENEDNVFHVFTCFADPKHVGTLPSQTIEGGNETEESLRKRMIILDGVTIKEGNARDYEYGTVRNIRMFYRGGGIMVDGSWTDAENNSGETNANAKGIRDIPLVISSSLFQDNNGIQGGAIFTNGTLNVFSSSFVQNMARGPVNNVKQASTDRTTALAAIQYVGGGAIATTADLLCVNTIFANNEAMLGDTQDLLNEETSRSGFEKQGFGGVIWGGTNSSVNLLNCNLVNNQAVSYPGIYLMSPNTSSNMHHFCVNTVFWGNKATGVPSNLSGTFSRITEISDDVVKFRTMSEKRSLVTPPGVETLYFCAYEEGKGPQDMKAAENITYGGIEYEPHAVPYSGDKSGIRNSFKKGDVYYNNNVIITSENEGVDGPNFLRPSTGPGRDGYSADANWMASRVNKLTDNGWSYLTVAPNEEDEMKFKVETEALQGEKAFEIEPDNTNSGGVFNYNSYKVNDRFHLNLMPLGSVDLSDEDRPRNYYMKFKGSGMTDQMGTGGQSFMQRISSNPLSRDEYEAYIDIGVYEYQHRTLKINQGSEIDVIWITDTEDPEKGNDGYTWETATSNVQVAIETLLKSRNDHGKRLNIIAGSYKPVTVVGDNLGYTLQTSAYNDGVYTPFVDTYESLEEPKAYGVRYINLRGGYDKEIPDENGYNYQKNQVVFSMEPRTGVKEGALNHILNIADIEQFKTTVTPQWVYDNENSTYVISKFTTTSEATGKAIPVIVEGITFENAYAQAESETNKGGAAISYKTQYQHKRKSDNPQDADYKVFVLDEEHPLEDPEDDSPKITIRNCTFSQNGKEVSDSETPASAVRIEEGGGRALVVNSVFHSNKGKPVDAVNTVMLNCTSAMNGGHITLTGDVSELHNSVIWQDDQRVASDKQQFEVPVGMCAYGGTTPVMTDKMTFNAISGLPKGKDAKGNEPLSDTNNDLEEGPNFLFMNPNDPDPEKRDFRIRPSLKLLDQGDNATYAKFVWPTYQDPTDYMKLMSNSHDDQTVEQEFTTKIREGDEVKVITYRGFLHDKDLDRAFTTRMLNNIIDRGAYECTGRGQRVIYVNPEKFGTGLESGSTWEDALGRGNLQRAIDAAAVYVRNNNSTKKAYVFVRGDNVYNEGEITIRDGVEVYGTAPITIEAISTNPTSEDKNYSYTDNELIAYVNRVKAERTGIVFKSLKTESFTPTYCSGLVSMGDYKLGSVFDGLMINNGISNTAEHPVVDIADDAKVAIRNCIIIHNRVGNDKDGNPQPVVNLAGGLLYNSLIYDDFGGDVVIVGENGYVLNCTVVADGTRQKAVYYAGESGTYADHVKNTIAVNEGASKKMFAPYLQEGANAYTPASHLTSHQPYGYQLHEKSAEIDAATLNNNEDVNGWLPEKTTIVTEESGEVTYRINYDQYVDIEHDRDLLGNPRIINGKVDNGCFETWLVKNGTIQRTLIQTNPKASLTKYVSDVAEGAEGYDGSTMVAPGDYWKDNFGGNFYPHAGSVIYIENSANLILDKIGSDPMFGEDNPLVPGYLLIEEGGSLYGQGNYVTATYVAVDKTISSQYSLVSVPYKCDPNSTVAITYDVGNGIVTQTSPSGLTGSTYDGEQRSKWDYHYKVENSDCWKPQSDFIPANTGWLLSLSAAPETPTTYRFTGWGDAQLDYIYTEDGSDKTVTLTQYNNLPDDGSAHFTKEENMGWNLTGLPWLVSNYATDTQSGVTYAMNVPHIFYSNLANTLYNTTDADSDGKPDVLTNGQFYTKQSWAEGSTLSPGEGFFTQTAVLGEIETLTFKLPEVPSGGGGGGARQRIGIRHQSDNTTHSSESVRFDDVVDVYPQEGADAALDYRLGSDGIKWMAFNKSVAQIYVENNVGTRMSLVSAAPVETEISLGVTVPEAGDYTINLPQPEAYADYEAVWVIDKVTGASANLLSEDFVLTAHESGDINNRLKLKFGGLRPEINSPVVKMPDVIKVTARNGRLPMRGIADETEIRIYNASGALVYQGPAAGCHSQYLPDGIYFISPLQR